MNIAIDPEIRENKIALEEINIAESFEIRYQEIWELEAENISGIIQLSLFYEIILKFIISMKLELTWFCDFEISWQGYIIPVNSKFQVRWKVYIHKSW